ncbi:MAG: 3-dehydroquinate synthase [Candidatus Izemoplasmatales bacterium]|jgi:3-dehydroquinate synthase|nr:3-dehydroquinate synthase [Candidatus Izemoplasmatales bacterium]
MKCTIQSSRFEYDIYIKNYILDNIKNFINQDKNYVIISDDNIPEYIINKVKNQINNCNVITFPEGEKSKSLNEYLRLINQLLQAGVTRDTKLIALGGGVTGDLVGFVSSTLFRGLEYIQIPTTLLSQIDSSVGGKVAINIDHFKNVVGSFYPPKLVLIDPTVLKTLSLRHFNNGMAEMIKYGMIFSEDLFNYIKDNNPDSNLEKLIYDCIKIKKKFIEEDEFDNNQRHLLNFGHTFGHAYEAYYGFKKYLHGEAVALGMMKVVDEKIKKELKEVLIKYDLPYEDSLDNKELKKYIKVDKKAKNDTIDIVLIERIGNAYIKKTKIDDL